MNSPTIEMEKTAALAKLESYEEAARKRPGMVKTEDRAILQGYRVLARGGRLVDVNDALRHGGLNLAGIPKLAIARAHAATTKWRADSDGSGTFWWHEHQPWNYRFRGQDFRWKVPEHTFDGLKLQQRDMQARTPLIPLPLRPRHDLSNYFLLWEASWTVAPPVDPYLLRPVTGSMMEIVAEWELSVVELSAVKAAMRQH